jgi:hypothetical protein
MKASEARKLSAASKPAYDKRVAEENAKYNESYQIREMARLTKIRTDIEDLLERCYACIKEATKNAQYKAECPIFFVAEHDEVVNGAIRRLKKNGYTAVENHDTIATGVDEYDDEYQLRISWEKE